MMYRLLSCAAMLAFAAAREDTITLRVPRPVASFKSRGGLQLQQLNNDSIVNVEIPLNVFSVGCGNQIADLNQDINANSALFNQYVALAVESFAECVVPGLVSDEDLLNNRGDAVVINAEICTGPINSNVEAREAFESLCESTTPAGSQVCDVTFYQNATFDNGNGGTYEVLLTYDTYYCIPSLCSADEVERLGVAILSGLQSVETPPGGENDFNVLSVCFDSRGYPRDFNGGAESYATGLAVSGLGVAQQSAASSIEISVFSDVSPNPLVDSVSCKVTMGTSAESFAKSCCSALNANADFQNLRLFCDISERNGPAPYNMTIFSPFDLEYRCQADLDAQDGLPSNQPVQLCEDFVTPAGVGIRLSGETFLFSPEPMPENELPPVNTLAPVIIDNQPIVIPPQQITGNGQAPPIVNLIGLDDNGVSSTRPSAFVASVACAAIAVLSSRL